MRDLGGMVERSLADREARDEALERNRDALDAESFAAAWSDGYASDPGRIAQQLLTGVSGHVDLTAREREILPMLALGLSHRAIGERLFITERTVEGHVARLFRKLGANARAAAISAAVGFEP